MFLVADYLRVCKDYPDLVLSGLELVGYGSWRGDYAEPCLFIIRDKDKQITMKELEHALWDLISGTVYEGYKGGTYTYNDTDTLHIELSYGGYEKTYETLIMVTQPDLFFKLSEPTYE